MKMLKEKKSIQKIAIVLVIAILCNFIFPTYSRAEDWWSGGALFNPIADFITGIGDAVIIILQQIFIGGDYPAVDKIDKGEYAKRLGASQFSNVLELINAGTSLLNPFGLGLLGEAFSDVPVVGGFIKPGGILRFAYDKFLKGDDKIVVALIQYSPGAIFSNNISLFDVNFIESKADQSSSTKALRDTISSWYIGFRNLSIVFLLSVLVYVAIRIILSSTAGETAKYKTMLKDWFIAICIVLFMHYIMAFILNATEKFTDIIAKEEVISEGVEGLKVDSLMSNVRMNIEEQTNIGMKFGYIIMYLMLVMYTLIFTWKYLKRVIYIAFLTMMAPLVALTYPIDKMRDGSAQAFSKWFKEYLFNVLIQPIHLILYVTLISSAMQLATASIIYAIVALAFMLEAEKIIKDFFGIQAQRGEGAGAISGGAIFGFAAAKIKDAASRIPDSSSGKSKGSSSGDNSNKIRSYNDRTAQKPALNPETFRGENSEGSGGSGGSDSPSGSGSTGGSGRPSGSGTSGGSDSPSGSGSPSGSNTLNPTSNNSGFRIRHPKLAKVERAVDKVGRPVGKFMSKNGVKMARLAAKGVGVATLGTIGLAAGLASDNDKDVLTYTGTGIVTGALSGKKAVDMFANANESAKGRGKLKDPDDPEEIEKRLRYEYAANKDNIRYFKSKYGDKYKEKMNTSLDLQKYGMKDQKDIDKAIGIMDEYGLPVDQAAFISDFAKNVSRNDLLDSKKNNANRDLVAQMLNVDLSTESGKKAVDKFMAPVNKFVGLPGNYKPKEEKPKEEKPEG